MKNIKIKNKKYQKGIALVEVIAALGVAVISITALISLSISTLRTSLDSKLLLEGTKMANREIELVRAFRDGNTWVDFIGDLNTNNCSNVDTGCHIDPSLVSLVQGDIVDGNGVEAVTRKFVVSVPDGGSLSDSPPPDVIRISVSVNWVVGNQEKGSYVYTDLSNWRGK